MFVKAIRTEKGRLSDAYYWEEMGKEMTIKDTDEGGKQKQMLEELESL